MTTTVTAKGQVTIPKPVRDFLGITPGSKVDFRRARTVVSFSCAPIRDGRPAGSASSGAMRAKDSPQTPS